MPKTPRKINVLVVERGKEPRSVLLRPTEEEITSILGDGPTEYMTLTGGECGVRIYAAMVCRTEDLREMDRNGDSMPRISLICGIGRRGIATLPEEQQALLRERHRIMGDRMLMDSGKARAAQTAQTALMCRRSAKILPFPASK